MPRFGRGQGFGFARRYGLGMGLGRGFWRGNPYPFCRFYPWLPRRWWAMGMTPYSVSPQPLYPIPPLYRPIVY